MNDKLNDVITELQYINCELQLQPIETKPESRIKELQEGLNAIKQYLDEYEKLSQRQDKVLLKIRDRKSR